MGRKLDLSGLTDNEAEHVLQVVQRDMKLRKEEEKRLSELKQDLDEEGNRCLLLSRQRCFNQRCCIRCCSPFTFLLNPKRQCGDCRYNVCKACRVYNKRDKAWLCCACQKSRLLKSQTVDWFYTNVKMRFKRYGSAKVLKTLYRKHLAERGALSELTEGSAYEESVNDEGSVCESDSTFYRQSEERSMSETLTVALRVAEEAVDEAISKAEFDTGSQEKQSEAHYLREHRGELTEELAQSIVQKIITRRKTLTEMRAESDQDWPLEQNTNPHHHHHQSVSHQASSLFKHQPNLWRSRSTFSLLDKDRPGLIQDFVQDLTKKATESTLSAWKSVDRLDNAGRGVSSVLKSPDGNWMALQSVQLSCPSLLSKRKSLVSSALERESGVVSAYEDKDTDDNTLEENHREKSDKAVTQDEDMASGGAAEPEAGQVRRSRRKRKSKKDQAAVSSAPVSSENNNQLQPHFVAVTYRPVTPAVLDQSDVTGRGANQKDGELMLKLQQLPESNTPEAELDKDRDFGDDGEREEISEEKDEEDECLWTKDIESDGGRTDAEKEEEEEEEDGDLEVDEEMKLRLHRLVQQSRLTYLSSTDDELDKFGQSERESVEDMEKDNYDQGEGLTYKLCQLEKEVKATQFSSTEDELDRVGAEDERRGKEDGSNEELAVRVCRLAHQVNATMFSSTEDELDGAGGDGERGMDEETLWELQAEKAVQAAQLRDLASLVSASQFSSTEDELDRAEKEEEVTQRTADQGGIYISFETEEGWDGTTERRESFADLDVKMFDLRDETEEETKETRERQEVKLKKAETVDLSESKVEKPENRPEGNGGESNTDQETQEETAGSEEEDAEFDRIISSMLTLTLEDMQGDTLKEDATEDGRVNTERQQTETGGRPESTGDTDTQLMSGNTKQQEDGDMDAQEAGSVAHDEEHADGRGNKCKPKETDGELEREKRADLTEPRVTSSLQERLQSPQEIQQRYSAVSLCSITTEMLKVLNATEELLQEVEGGEATRLSTTSLPPNTDPKKLDHQFSRLEENVYVTAGSVYSLEAELSDLEECARGISSATSDMELSFLEEQVASAAAKVRQSELQVCNIAARIASLKSAGLNVDTQSRVMTVTPDSRPALPQREDKDLSH